MGSPEKPIDVEMGDMSEEAKLNPSTEKFEEAKENGGVKEERFTGLKKEDLLKISSQPNWVRARWALFILFWIIWIAMLVGAILIVVNAPRCKPEPEPQWYQDTVVYEVNAVEFDGGYEGLKNRLPYIDANLHAKTILLSGASKATDPATVEGNETEFKEVIDAVHNFKDKGYVMVDIVVDSLPTSSSLFTDSSSSSCLADNSGNNCDLFVWREGSDTTEGYTYVSTRNASYKALGNNRAAINYGGRNALSYIKSVIQSWFNRGVNGIKISDVNNLENIEQDRFVAELWDLQEFQNDSSRALFVYSSNPDAEITSPVVVADNETNTAHSPVFLTAGLHLAVNENDAGMKMENVITNFRNQSRNIGGYVVSPPDERLAAARFGGLAAGFNLLSMSLPGVPILRSGDESAAMSPVFTWDKKAFRDSVPLNGSDEIRGQTKELIVRRVAGIQAKPSLRFDTRDNDTIFDFLDVGQKDVIAFIRKWDKKSAVLVVSNLSPSNHTVNLAVQNGLMKDKKPSEKAKVVVSSDPNISGELDITKLELNRGTTLVLEN